MIFVDSGAWFASVADQDPNHPPAMQWIANHATERLLTTDYVIDETLTLLRSRGYGRVAIELGTRFFSNQAAEIIRIETDDLLQAWNIFRTHADKAWSFTDCTSKVVMARLGITTAFAFDHHFRQFGTVQVVP